MDDQAALRQYVYDFLDLEADDAPPQLIDKWAREGHTRIAHLVRQFPHYRQLVEFNTESGTHTYDVDPIRLHSITAVEGPRGPLEQISVEQALSDFYRLAGRPDGKPTHFSEWSSGKVRLWPTPDDEYEMDVWGYRAPRRFPASAADVPDLPEHFEDVLRSFVLWRAYLHQDATELADYEKKAFDEALNLAMTDEMAMPQGQPLIMGGGRPPAKRIRRVLYPWEG